MAGLGTIELKAQSYFKAHLVWCIVILIAGISTYLGLSSWLKEHDERLLAETKIAELQPQIKALEQQLVDRKTETDRTIAVLQAAKLKVSTPQQAIQAIPTVTDLPVTTTADPNFVQVPVLPFYQEMNQCKQNEVQLKACLLDKKDLEAISGKKDEEVAALKKKPSFWKRFKDGAKKIGVGVMIGLVAREVIKP